MAYIHNANSIQIFKWKQTLEKFLLFLNLCVTLWVFSHSSWFPITIEAFCFFHSKLMLLLNNSFYTFLLLNAILLSLYAFSKTKDDDNSDYYNDYLNHSESLIKEDCNNKKPVTCSDDQVGEGGCCYSSSAVMTDETVTTVVTETTTTTMTMTTCCTTLSMTTVTGDKVSGEKCYRRTHSGGVERRRRMVAELKRYNTGLGRDGRSCHVEQLSKEEFNRTVEDFIAKHKRMLLEEQRKTEKT
ncbi:hypothetical protein RIF29_12839 [Crotalaria pallida]|uniref:Transmembrane protein n=1 Tax=Crotalaria pallida TaxID=3830 RepID=A0AAN9INL1_CROPI